MLWYDLLELTMDEEVEEERENCRLARVRTPAHTHRPSPAPPPYSASPGNLLTVRIEPRRAGVELPTRVNARRPTVDTSCLRPIRAHLRQIRVRDV
jgi:hypothetical protein